MASDLGALLLSGALAYWLWALPVKGQPAAMYVELVPLFFLFALGYAQLGLYPGFGIGPVETLRRLTYVTSFAFLVLAASSFALKVPHLYSRVTFVIAFVLSLVLVPAMRVGVLRMVRRWRRWCEPVAIIGTEQRALHAAQSLSRTDHIGFRPVAVLALDSLHSCTQTDALPVFGGLAPAPGLASRGIRVALLAPHEQQNRATVDLLLRHFRHVVLLRDYDDLPVEGLQIRNLGSLVGVEYTNNLLLHSNQIFKRALDIVLGTAAFVLFLPLIGLAALLVRLFDGAPSFYAQRRPGLGGRDVSVAKLRTMRRDADKHLESCLASNPALREEWQTTYKLRDDPRLVPALGRFFRRYSIDELPQLWAVVCGSMSLVGPRPFPDYHLERFPAEFVELRQRVRPGITGLWQVTVRSGGTVEEQQAYDTYYIRNWSVWLDVYILSRTLAAVFTGRGAF
jgi:Undecaprenyl-phosphate galactose phosphotransferase WbaP